MDDTGARFDLRPDNLAHDSPVNIVSAQASNQDIPVGIVNGGYKTVTVNGVSGGSGTASIAISLSGGTAPRAAGTITCVSKDIGGVKHWFITSFARN